MSLTTASLADLAGALGELDGVLCEDLTGDEALVWCERAMGLRNAVDQVLASLSARVDRLSDPARPGWSYARRHGYRSGAALMSARTGLSMVEVSKLIAMGTVVADADAHAGQAPSPGVDAPLSDIQGAGDDAGGTRGGDDPGAGGVTGAGEGGDATLDGAYGPVVEAEAILRGTGDAELSPSPSQSPSPSLSHRPVEVYPVLAAALREGRLSLDQGRIITQTLAGMSVNVATAEQRLVSRGASMRIEHLRRLCHATLAELDPAALAAREESNRQSRYLRLYEEADGMVTLRGRLDVATAAPVRTWLDAQARAALARRRDTAHDAGTDRDDIAHAPDERDIGQIYADALASAFHHVTGCEHIPGAVKTTVIVRINNTDLEHDLGIADCDASESPITAGQLRRMAVDVQILPAVMGGPSCVLDFGFARRLYSPAQRAALVERDRGCAMCGNPPSQCDVHHIQWWSRGGRTDLDNAVLLCVGCHHRIHDHGWDIHITNNHVYFIPPASIDPSRRPRPATPTPHTANAPP